MSGSAPAPVSLAATAHRLPERVMGAREIAALSGIPAEIVAGRFGITSKHVAAPDQHVSDMAVEVGSALLTEHGADPAAIDAVCYFGSTYKDFPVWHVAPLVAHRLGATRAFALELDYVSCGGPVALRVCRDMMVAEPDLQRILLVGAARESALLDYANQRARFTINFGDGAVAALLTRDPTGPQVLGSAAITDGSLALQVKVPVGGSARPWREGDCRPHLDVADPVAMKERLDAVSMDNFTAVARLALERSGLAAAPIDLLCALHMKRSMHEALCAALEVPGDRAVYLEDTGHMSGVDTLLALDRATRAGRLAPGDVALLLAAGTGYTWAATVVRWPDA